MTVWFISRHPGAIDWVRQRNISIDHYEVHLDIAQVAAGDLVIGTLPIHMAAEVCQRGARFFFLALDLPAEYRGRELTAEDIDRCHGRLVPYHVTELP